MNQTDVMLKIVEMARVGGALPADEAVSLVAAKVARLDMSREGVQQEATDLMRLGATIWSLAGPR
ncbi:hypothetical protein SAMN05518845_1242 [Variovorax sp. YR750]|jgi:hypothetical protein|uniref:Uncharacterized protein n=1 Tax=Variovorax gossypii TaxID=1679495 RepID=A0A3S0J435_9BURK|nr:MULTISPECIES: hypothetical protein [Variovorax]MDP9606401.1 hypothetical protein [Variovorax paradoxus]RTQ32783.1 hypothetical protein EJP69_18850 [Variovorax gossypii]SEM40981.1 hypothetical protein SAMN05518845_1242 [Variovorax sp. YR750]